MPDGGEWAVVVRLFPDGSAWVRVEEGQDVALTAAQVGQAGLGESGRLFGRGRWPQHLRFVRRGQDG